ncbi:MAG: PAS domain S-box protein [Deltaproteobacteria bacterium]|nr:PAS domain S-box protein [Deltaproteobacteria bacterium]
MVKTFTGRGQEKDFEYKAFAENLPGIIYRTLLREGGRMLFFNEMLKPVTGFSEEELDSDYQHSISAIILPEDLAYVKSSKKKAVEDHLLFEIDYRVRHKSGGIRYLRDRGRLVSNDNGEPLYIDGVIFDVTDYMLAERRIEESERKYRHLFENLNDAAFLADADTGVIIETNKKGELLLRMERGEIIGMRQRGLHPEGKADEYSRRFAAHIAMGHPADYDGEVERSDKTIVPVHISAAPVEIGDKRLILGLFRDITERKMAEKNLLQEKNFSDGVINSLPGIFYLITEDLKFVRWNRNFEDISGYEGREISRMEPADFFPKDAIPLVDSKIKEVFRKGVSTVEADFLSKDGRRVPYFFTGIRIVLDGIPHLVGIGLDISERKKMEEEVLKSQKLESLGVLAGGIAHEFNNYLTAIIGNISYIKSFLNIGEDIEKRLTDAEKASTMAKSLASQLLTFSSGGTPIKKTAHISSLIREAACFALRNSERRREFSIPDDLYAADIDEGQIKQAINNIVSNADQFMGKEGIVRISAKNITFHGETSALHKGNYVRISIADEGIGIPEENLNKIFDPYFTTRPKANGLGLSIAYSITKAHGGYINVESKAGAGSTFHLYLPASGAKLPKLICYDVPISGKGRILLMDDDEAIRDISGHVLKRLGYEVSFAKDGADAIKQYQNAKDSGEAFSAVIMDLTIHRGMGGKDAVKILLEIDPAAKVIVSSGYSNDLIMSDYKKYGFRGILTKPYKISELSEAVHKVLNE